MAPTSKRGCGPWLSGRVANPFGLHDQLPSTRSGDVVDEAMPCRGTVVPRQQTLPVQRAIRPSRQPAWTAFTRQAWWRYQCRDADKLPFRSGRNRRKAPRRNTTGGQNLPDGGRGCIRRDRHHPPAGGRERLFPCCRIQQPWRRPRWPSVGRPTGSTPGWRRGGDRREPVDRGAGARPLWVLLSPESRRSTAGVAQGNGHTLPRDALLDAIVELNL